MTYFSESEFGEVSRDKEEIGYIAWRGLLSMIQVRVTDGYFGKAYPAICEDGTFVVSTNVGQFDDALLAEVPRLATLVEHDYSYNRSLTLQSLGALNDAPPTPEILDIIQFCWKNIAKPSSAVPHPNFFYQHYHLLDFDVLAGREEFRAEIETIFRRNGIAYQLTEQGRIERLLDPVQHEALANHNFETGDSELDDLLDKSRVKFLNPDPETRREALEHLWDAWEKLKSLDGQGDVRQRATAMLDRTAGSDSPKFREVLEKEADKLYKIGNQLNIRHRNMHQEAIAQSEHADYLFHRMFSLVQMILRLR